MNRYCKNDVQIESPKEKSIVDQFPCEDFNRTQYGTLRNDIAALVAAQTEQEFNLILSRLQELRADDQYQGMSDDELLAHIKPRLMQDPVELARFGEYVGNIEKVKMENDKKVEIPSEVTPSVEPEKAAD